MSLSALVERFNQLVEFLRQQEQDHADEIATLEDDIASLRSRLDALESRLVDIE